MQTKKLSASFTTSRIGDHFRLTFRNEKDLETKTIGEVFTVGHESVTVRLTPRTALELVEFIDRTLEDYDFSLVDDKKRVNKKKK
jgi:hypothetical protein